MAVKPSPEIVWEIMRTAGVERAEEVLYVGDSDVDMLTAHNAGVDAVGVSWGFRPKEELAAHSPRAIIDTPSEILKLLEK
jgi:phosphoglycolate phosphatase